MLSVQQGMKGAQMMRMVGTCMEQHLLLHCHYGLGEDNCRDQQTNPRLEPRAREGSCLPAPAPMLAPQLNCFD